MKLWNSHFLNTAEILHPLADQQQITNATTKIRNNYFPHWLFPDLVKKHSGTNETLSPLFPDTLRCRQSSGYTQYTRFKINKVSLTNFFTFSEFHTSRKRAKRESAPLTYPLGYYHLPKAIVFATTIVPWWHIIRMSL